MMLAFIILSVVSVVTGITLLNKMSDHKEDVVETPPFDQEPIVILDPPVLPTLPDAIDWDSLNCLETEAKLDELRQFLMVVKIPQEVYEFWVEQIQRGEKSFAIRCITTDLEIN